MTKKVYMQPAQTIEQLTLTTCINEGSMTTNDYVGNKEILGKSRDDDFDSESNSAWNDGLW